MSTTPEPDEAKRLQALAAAWKQRDQLLGQLAGLGLSPALQARLRDMDPVDCVTFGAELVAGGTEAVARVNAAEAAGPGTGARLVPGNCAACRGTDLKPHCPSWRCRWGRCKGCGEITGVGHGQFRSIGKAA